MCILYVWLSMFLSSTIWHALLIALAKRLALPFTQRKAYICVPMIAYLYIRDWQYSTNLFNHISSAFWHLTRKQWIFSLAANSCLCVRFGRWAPVTRHTCALRLVTRVRFSCYNMETMLTGCKNCMSLWEKGNFCDFCMQTDSHMGCMYWWAGFELKFSLFC